MLCLWKKKFRLDNYLCTFSVVEVMKNSVWDIHGFEKPRITECRLTVLCEFRVCWWQSSAKINNK